MYINATIKARIEMPEYATDDEINESFETFVNKIDEMDFIPIEGGSKLIELNASLSCGSSLPTLRRSVHLLGGKRLIVQ